MLDILYNDDKLRLSVLLVHTITHLYLTAMRCYVCFRCNTTHEVLASLGSNDSVVSWSSALATPVAEPHLGHQAHTSPTTIERLTLHPKQGLRQNVITGVFISFLV